MSTFEVTTYVLSQEIFTNAVKARSKAEAVKKAEKIVQKEKQRDSWIDESVAEHT